MGGGETLRGASAAEGQPARSSRCGWCGGRGGGGSWETGSLWSTRMGPCPAGRTSRGPLGGDRMSTGKLCPPSVCLVGRQRGFRTARPRFSRLSTELSNGFKTSREAGRAGDPGVLELPLSKCQKVLEYMGPLRVLERAGGLSQAPLLSCLVALVLVTSVPGAGGNGAGARLQGWGLLTRTGLPCPLACSENASLGARAGLGSMRWAGRGRRCCPPECQPAVVQDPVAHRPEAGFRKSGSPTTQASVLGCEPEQKRGTDGYGMGGDSGCVLCRKQREPALPSWLCTHLFEPFIVRTRVCVPGTSCLPQGLGC